MKRFPAFIPFAALLLACGGDPTVPMPGRLPVAINGLPPGTGADVTVTGPDGIPRLVEEGLELTGLTAGAYEVTAGPVETGGVRYGATIDRPAPVVPPAGRGPVVRVSYAAVTGRLTLAIAGRPTGMPANVSVTSGAGLAAVVDSSAELTLLPPGAYTLAAPELTLGGAVYRPDPATQIVVVQAGVVPASATITYGTGSAEIDLTIAGLPAAAAANVIVSGPGGYRRALGSSTTLRHLVAGTYTITSGVAGADLVTFTPTLVSQGVTLADGESASATVTYSGSDLDLRLELVAEGLNAPVLVTAPPGDARLFVVERQGRVRIVQDGALLATPFLDIESRVNFVGERGLLGMAFDPAFATNGRFFVYYVDLSGGVTLERFSSATGASIAGPSDGVVLAMPHGGSEHHGGTVAFGPDHMLYLGPGDGRCCGDPDQNAQNLSSRLGKILRLDVRQLPYAVPVDNPFAGGEGPGAPEIWASGLRNPWRFSFDVESGRLFIADVGQDAREEINAVPATSPGLNYGWPRMEGTACYSPATNCDGGLLLTGPVHEYTHADGCSVTGGYVYRGSAIPELRGRYLYADFCRGWVKSFRMAASSATEHRTWTGISAPFTVSFGVDGAGELYLVSQGRVWRLVRG